VSILAGAAIALGVGLVFWLVFSTSDALLHYERRTPRRQRR